ncbi:hypothetical protein ACFSKX_14950 [Microbulbifer halophilus]|uniref:Uncharacterized protein n=2 Tax=Microbulbifer halophilus TaxID=453963 RepID=A0ABW5EED0_9GAMM
MYVTIIGSKIFYADDLGQLCQQIKNYQTNGTRSATINQRLFYNNLVNYAYMTDEQFVRFKNAGRRHPSRIPNKMVGQIDRTRGDRSSGGLQKWDVGEYGSLTGKSGPWGNGSLTNRDHMTANSSNQQQFNTGTWPGSATTRSEVKREGLAIAVSGHHHRKASYTYGGRTRSPSPMTQLNRMQFGAQHPTDAFFTEMNSMLDWKSSHLNSNNVQKNTLRLEMVGAYAYMYKLSVDQGFIDASWEQDLYLVIWMNHAVSSDNTPTPNHPANHHRK